MAVGIGCNEMSSLLWFLLVMRTHSPSVGKNYLSFSFIAA
uniref:Uncharacterized protein n=1 Tax=Anguilla anguilla TaxID=7936 RepID=A0A0E9R8B2_ANGAN